MGRHFCQEGKNKAAVQKEGVMISIKRPEKPTILKEKETEWTREYLAAYKAHKEEPDSKKKPALKKQRDKIAKHYKEDEISASLRQMHSPTYKNKILKTVKCAYCEGYITDTGQPHIEHFRPKESYPELCFEWTNLLMACVCYNVNYIGTKFPLHQIQDPTTGEQKEECIYKKIDAALQACYINPAQENPNDFFLFEYDADLGEALIRPKNGNLRAKRMIQDLGLNERTGLLARRTEAVEDMLEIIADLQEENLSPEFIERKKERFRKHLHPSAAFSAFAHSLVQQFNLHL